MSALLGRSDKAAGWTGKTAGSEDQQGCSSCLLSMAGACKCYCCSTSDQQSEVEEHQWTIKSSFGITLLSDLIKVTDFPWRTYLVSLKCFPALIFFSWH